ncbi:MAG: DUF3179 domain-containing protein [Balneolaceae bacterium]|nr:DUF3179 domain-containing protein [Balneolaceae bacterium]
MKYLTKYLSLALIVILSSCGSVSDSSSDSRAKDGNTNSGWLIPSGEVVDGGPGKDGIPSIDNPRFSDAQNTGYVADSRLVTGIRIGDTIKAYPHQVMDHHEIVNDQAGSTAYCLTLCPLTGTAIAWDRMIDGEIAEYGVSGRLFRNNLIPYDRKTDSRYSQMQVRGVNGSRAGSELNTLQVVQTTWATWKAMYPESEVLTTNTGFSRNYSGFLYGRGYYSGNSGTLFPVQHSDNRLPTKERLHGVIAERPADEDARVKVYEIDEFGEGVSIIEDQFNGEDIIIVGSSDKNFAASFKPLMADGTPRILEAVQDALPVVMEDQDGNRYDIFGYAVQGPRAGERLQRTFSYTGFWFAWIDFFPGLELYQTQNS